MVRKNPHHSGNGLDLRHATGEDLRAYVTRLEGEFEKMKERLLYQELIVQRTKDEIERKAALIQKIRDEIMETAQKTPTQIDAVAALKDELEKAGIEPASNVFGILDKIAKILESKTGPSGP